VLVGAFGAVVLVGRGVAEAGTSVASGINVPVGPGVFVGIPGAVVATRVGVLVEVEFAGGLFDGVGVLVAVEFAGGVGVLVAGASGLTSRNPLSESVIAP